MQRRLDIAVAADLSEHLLEDLCALFSLGRAGRIVIIKKFKTGSLLFYDLIIIRQIEFSAVELIVFLHMSLLLFAVFGIIIHLSGQKSKREMQIRSVHAAGGPMGSKKIPRRLTFLSVYDTLTQ